MCCLLTHITERPYLAGKKIEAAMEDFHLDIGQNIVYQVYQLVKLTFLPRRVSTISNVEAIFKDKSFCFSCAVVYSSGSKLGGLGGTMSTDLDSGILFYRMFAMRNTFLDSEICFFLHNCRL